MTGVGGRLSLLLVICTLAAQTQAADAPVSVKSDEQNYTLSNGIVTAKISRWSGNLSSLVYNGTETLDGGNSSGYWSHSAAGNNGYDEISIDPKKNNGEMGEVSV